MKRLLAAALLFTTVSCGSKDYVVQPTPANIVTVTFAAGAIQAEIAATAAARSQGLMGRSVASIGANGGMLFVFPADQAPNAVAFYMVDTPAPLSIAFLDSDMHVLNTADMAPNTSDYHFAAGVFRYALEVNQGWLAAHGVTTGSTASFTLPAGTIISIVSP
jgi:hypothetical protein